MGFCASILENGGDKKSKGRSEAEDANQALEDADQCWCYVINRDKWKLSFSSGNKISYLHYFAVKLKKFDSDRKKKKNPNILFTS